MRPRAHISWLLILCVLGSGAQWDVLQVFAWSRMFAGYAKTMGVSAAAARTFDGEMCPLCRLVAKAEHQEAPKSAAPDVRGDVKVLLFCQEAAAVVLPAPLTGSWPQAAPCGLTEARPVPLLPPPRAAVV